MKLIFLDFDGILFTLRSGLLLGGKTNFTNGAEPDWPAIRAIARKCHDDDWLIIPVTTWMQLPAATLEVLTQIGLSKFLHPEWNTDLHTDQSPKIEAYLQAHPEVIAWIILDDCDFNWTPLQRSHWMQGCMFQGLTYRQLEQLEHFAGLDESRLNWQDWKHGTPPVRTPVILRDAYNEPWRINWTTAQQQTWDQHPGDCITNPALPKNPQSDKPATQWSLANGAAPTQKSAITSNTIQA